MPLNTIIIKAYGTRDNATGTFQSITKLDIIINCKPQTQGVTLTISF